MHVNFRQIFRRNSLNMGLSFHAMCLISGKIWKISNWDWDTPIHQIYFVREESVFTYLLYLISYSNFLLLKFAACKNFFISFTKESVNQSRLPTFSLLRLDIVKLRWLCPMQIYLMWFVMENSVWRPVWWRCTIILPHPLRSGKCQQNLKHVYTDNTVWTGSFLYLREPFSWAKISSFLLKWSFTTYLYSSLTFMFSENIWS